jgi:hypothetical protein
MFRENAILRIQTEKPLEKNKIFVRLHGRILKETFIEGELFPQPYQECIPEDHSYYADYEVPVVLLEKSWNKFSLYLDDGDGAIIQRMELALYRNEVDNKGIAL